MRSNERSVTSGMRNVTVHPISVLAIACLNQQHHFGAIMVSISTPVRFGAIKGAMAKLRNCSPLLSGERCLFRQGVVTFKRSRRINRQDTQLLKSGRVVDGLSATMRSGKAGSEFVAIERGAQ